MPIFTRRGARLLVDTIKRVQSGVLGGAHGTRKRPNTYAIPYWIRLTGDADEYGRYPWIQQLHVEPNGWVDGDFSGGAYDDDLACEINAVTDADQSSVYSAWRNPETGRLIFADNPVAKVDAKLGPCDCPTPPYLIEVDCPPCAVYGYPAKMPRFWDVNLGTPRDNPYSDSTCPGTPCGDMPELISIENEGYRANEVGNCTWSGRKNCIRAELTLGSEHAQVTLLDPEDCILAVFRKPIDEFVCCGINEGWELVDGSACDMDLTLSPDRCTCCPDCDPNDNDETCDQEDCCVTQCDLSVTVENLCTAPGIPCGQFDDPCYTASGEPCPYPVGDPGRLGCFSVPPGPTPEASCGGMNGGYSFQWIDTCVWLFVGTPSGSGSTRVRARLSMSGKTWLLVIQGEDGQVATFQSDGADCNWPITLAFVPSASTCASCGPTPVATLLSF